jgi:hypothetical protein
MYESEKSVKENEFPWTICGMWNENCVQFSAESDEIQDERKVYFSSQHDTLTHTKVEYIIYINNKRAAHIYKASMYTNECDESLIVFFLYDISWLSGKMCSTS